MENQQTSKTGIWYFMMQHAAITFFFLCKKKLFEQFYEKAEIDKNKRATKNNKLQKKKQGRI